MLYGTLFDHASAAVRRRDVLGYRLARLNALWRDKQLQYTWLRAVQGGTPISGRWPARCSISMLVDAIDNSADESYIALPMRLFPISKEGGLSIPASAAPASSTPTAGGGR